MVVGIMCTSSISGDWKKLPGVEAAAYAWWPAPNCVTAIGLNDVVESAHSFDTSWNGRDAVCLPWSKCPRM